MVKRLIAAGMSMVMTAVMLMTLAAVPATAQTVVGDLNGDGALNMRDVLLLYRVGSGQAMLADTQGDFNGDGVVTVRDALILYQSVSENTAVTVPTTTTTTTTTTTITTTTTTKKPTTTTTKKTTTTTSAIQEVYRLVNTERAKAGLPALKYGSAAQVAANVRVKEIGTTFSHTRPDGRRCFTVFEDNGLSWGSAVGENIAKGYSTPAEVVKAWMDSADHRKHIVSTSYTHIVVGYDPSTKAWVQLFYKP